MIPTTPKSRARTRAERREPESKGPDWSIYPDDVEGGFVCLYYLGPERRKHRIPRKLATAEDRASYTTAFVEVMRDKHTRGEVAPLPSRAKLDPAALTFEKFAEKLTDGTLHQEYPDHVRALASETSDDYAALLRDYVNPTIGPKPLAAVTRADALAVMAKVPARLSSARRRHVAQVMARVLALAAFPANLIPASPLPRGFLPKKGPARVKNLLWADEEAQLLRAPADKVPLLFRCLYAFLDREGCRKEEAATLEWSDAKGPDAAGWIDLKRGWLYLDTHKTVDKTGARDWPIGPDVKEALTRWRKLRPDTRFVFETDSGAPMNVDKLAAQLRDHAMAAGIDRPELHESTQSRRRLVAHDGRALFITTAIVMGRSEGWIKRRTGHSTSAMLEIYRRHADNLAEGADAALVPMHSAIPELAALAPSKPSGDGGGTPKGSAGTSEGEESEACSDLCHGRPAAEIDAALTVPEQPETAMIPDGCDGRDSNPQAFRRWNLKAPENREDRAVFEGRDDTRAPSGSHGSDGVDPSVLSSLLALARAVDGLLAAGLAQQARPLAAQLVTALERLQTPGAEVVSLDARRGRS